MASSYQYLTEANIFEVYKTSRQYTDGLTDRFFEYERIMRNQPHPSVPKELPKVTDGTTASVIRKTPHRAIQQLPTGTVKSDTEDWLTIVASFIYTHKIIPHANEGYALIQKCWDIVERMLGYGFCATYTPFIATNGEFITDVRLIHWGDLFLQPGRLSGNDSNYVFYRTWWQTSDIEALVASQEKLDKKTEKTWNLGALNEVKDYMVNKEDKAKSASERELSLNSKGGVELIIGVQKGVAAEFITFHPQSETIVRVKKNKDPRGEHNIDFAYGDIDSGNPFGRSIIELIGSVQNMIDSEMQMYQFNRALGLAPPVVTYGFNSNKFKYVPNNVIKLDDPTGFIKPVTVDTTALVNFANNYGLLKSQLLNLVASPDTSIGSDVGNPGFSKTPAGVNAVQANLSVDDNYVRKQFESWFERWSETAINVYFAERTGIEELQLDDETAEALKGLDNFDQTLLSDDNVIRIDYSTATPALKFEVNASSSQLKNDTVQNEIIMNLIETVMKYPQLNKNYGGRIDVDELTERLITTSGIEDAEQVAPELTKEQKAAKQQSAQQPNGFSPLFDKPTIQIRYPDLPPSAQIQVLGLAGIHVTEQDIMQGAILDPNASRGEINPINDPNMLVPGGGTAGQAAAAAAPAGMPPANPLQQDGVNLTPQEVTRLQSDPRFAPAQQAQPPQSPSQLPPEDQAFVNELQQAGVPEQMIGHALVLLHKGMAPEDIIKQIMEQAHGVQQ